MSDEPTQAERALILLSNLESWIRHSDKYQTALFGFDEDITDQSALDLVAWIKRQIETPEQGV